MPIYEFECKKCKKKFEILISSSSTVAACPACSGTNLKRLVSAFAFTSKGAHGDSASSSGCSGCSGGSCSH